MNNSTTSNETSAAMLTAENVTIYCGDGLDKFSDAYREAHGYVSLVVCLFGSVANSLNIAVLTRREMNSPTNALLTGLAVADLLVMLEYIPFACHNYLTNKADIDRFSYPWAAFVLFHSHFAQVCHTVSIWLTVTLAVWRYIAVAHPQRNRELCSMKTTIAAIVSAYVVCPLICVPAFLTFSVQSKVTLVDSFGRQIGSSHVSNSTLPDPGPRNVTLYHVNLSDMGKANGELLAKINIWVYSVVIKLIPCVALTVLSLRLICALLETKRRRQQLASASKKHVKSSRMAEKERQTDRTTRMLLAVLLLFLVTEFPQGILGLLSVWLGQVFFEQCYNKLGDVMDILALVNSAINFILYCAMSRQFRTTFSQLFRPKVLDRWLPVPQANGDNGNGCTTVNNMTQVTQV